jgi:hypothetical protein
MVIEGDANLFLPPFFLDWGRCLRHEEIMRSSNRIDLTGQTFGFLTVIRHHHTVKKKAWWLCACSCGKEVVARGMDLRSGHRLACAKDGHYWRPTRGTGYQGIPEYKTWTGMIERCRGKTGKKCRDYGGRGIKVCERWRKSFPDFLADMGPKPEANFTIERKDVNGNYEPDNCIWIPMKDQARNRRNSHFITIDGEKVLLIEYCERYGLDRSVVYARLKMGWRLEEAICIPTRPRKPNRLTSPSD